MTLPPQKQLQVLRTAGDDLRLVWVTLLSKLDVNGDDADLLEAMTCLGGAMKQLELVEMRTQIAWTNQRIAQRDREQALASMTLEEVA